jgi:sialate O-acetylesterase
MNHVRRWLASVLVLSLPLGTAYADASTTALLDEMFQDHAVLQRDRPIPLWGQAQANDEITVELNGASAKTHADADGRWHLELPAAAAGGPFEITARTSSGLTQTIADVLIGDVWLCSGQSNMEWPIRIAQSANAEIARAPNDDIRLLTIAKDTSPTPLEDFKRPVRWERTTSESAADFSAVCFFFARELYKHIKVPMGLVHSSWGGSKIEPWMSASALRAVGGYDEMLEILALRQRDPREAVRLWGQKWEAWWRTRSQERPWSDAKQGEWAKAPAVLSHWEEWDVPALAQFNGMVWFRAEVNLSAQQAQQGATLLLGRVDDVDMTWINGSVVGSTAGPDTERAYELPQGTLKKGANTIVVNALDLWGPGGIWGASASRALKLQDGTSIPLDGRWEYRIVPKSFGEPLRAPWDETAGQTIIGNAMIAPLGNYQMRGVLWYQGESNTEEAHRYEALLTHWIEDWRGRFGEDATLLIVQLANYGPPPAHPTESGWAEVRDAQRRVVAKDDNAGLAVTIDIGDRFDIHPVNKQQVGYRLARAARHVIYGDSITPSGPVPKRAHRQGDAVLVDFTDIDGALVAYSSDHPIGFELCEAEPKSCSYALATIEGNSVRLTAPNASGATRVRFCWADSPVCTLYDGASLPAGPFEIAIE